MMKMSNIEFTSLGIGDIKDIARLDKECFSVPWSESSFLADVNNPLAHYVLAKIDGELCGYCGIYKVLDEGQITNIAVKEKFRRCGIAAKILEKIIEYAKENEIISISLEVRESNVAAISLYKKYGFLPVGLRKNYYHNPTEAAVLMELII